MENYRIYLTEQEIPTHYYNLRADMEKKPAPLLNPGTMQPMTAEELTGVFCEELVSQELDNDTRYIEIPEEIREYYKIYRPSPVVRAYNLEKQLGTPAAIYFKFEGNNTSGSHKLNSAAAQAYYAKKQGLKGVTTETGAGQWGTATQVGRALLEQFPGTSGSLGCAISEAVEVAVGTDGYRYVLGSVLNQVLLHQSVIGQEAYIALKKIGVKPDIIIGCTGGGSNLGGLIAPFMGENLRGEEEYRFIAAEPASCPSLTRGKYMYDFCDTGNVCPLAKMYTLGNKFIPSPIHAGGLRFHGMSTIISELYDQGMMEAVAYEQTEVFEAAEIFARAEGVLPAPESSHAIKAAIDTALECKESGNAKTILFGLSGTGCFDLVAYQQFNDGTMTDYIPTDEDLAEAIKCIPHQPKE